MNNLSISFASLVKNNGGLFKSEKQSKFLSSQLVDGEYWVFSKAFKNTSAKIYLCDDKGVLKVTNKNTVKGNIVFKTVWDRNDKSYQEAIEAKKAKQQKRREKEDLQKEVERKNYEAYMTDFKRYTIFSCKLVKAFEVASIEECRKLGISEDVIKVTSTFLPSSLKDLIEQPINDFNKRFVSLAEKLEKREDRIYNKLKDVYY